MKNKQKKTEFKFFTIVQWKQEEAYLQARHRTGWRFTYVNFLGCYHFEACEPEDVVYQLDYNPEGTAHIQDYIQIFHDCGWEYLQDFCGYSYFRKPVSMMCGEEEIFCDDDSRLDMIKRVYKGRLIPLLIIFFSLILPQLFLQSHLNGTPHQILTGLFAAVFLFYMALFFWFGCQFWMYWKSMRR